MFHILASLFCLCYTATSYGNALWPAAVIASLLVGGPDTDVTPYVALLLVFPFIPFEAYLYYRCLKGISYLRALCYAIVANITTSLATFVSLLLLYTDIAFIVSPLVTYNIVTNVVSASFVFVFMVTALIELIVMKLVTGYSLKKIIVPALSGYVLTIAILIIAQLIFNFQR